MKKYSEKIKEILAKEPDPAYKRRAKIILENLEMKGNEKILEIGCGRGFYAKTLLNLWPKIDFTGVDLNKKYLLAAKKNCRQGKARLIQGDATELPFKDRGFDRILATEILEHIPNDGLAISEMCRVMKPGGKAVVTVPNKRYPFWWDPANWLLERLTGRHLPANIWWLSGIWADHVRLYDENELKEKLEGQGFKVEKVWRATSYCFPFSHFLFYGVGKNLVEKGWLPEFNRFSETGGSRLSSILLFPIYFIDRLNEKPIKKISSVNLVYKISRPV